MQSRSRDTLADWSDESFQDRRNTRWALIVAVLVHAVIFRLQLPETVAAEVRPAKRPVFVMQPTRFEPPPPREERKLPEPRTRRQPVPDPTPDEPEPLVTAEEVEVRVDLADSDIVWDLPAAPPPEPPRGLMQVGGDVLPPVKLHAPPPGYTEIARAARLEGDVIVEAVIDATGRVASIRVLKSLPLGLDQSAVDAVSKWRFEPATWKGRPVPVLYNLTIRFRLS